MSRIKGNQINSHHGKSAFVVIARTIARDNIRIVWLNNPEATGDRFAVCRKEAYM